MSYNKNLKTILFQSLCHGQGGLCSALISNCAEIRTQRSTAEMLYIKYTNLLFRTILPSFKITNKQNKTLVSCLSSISKRI